MPESVNRELILYVDIPASCETPVCIILIIKHTSVSKKRQYVYYFNITYTGVWSKWRYTKKYFKKILAQVEMPESHNFILL